MADSSLFWIRSSLISMTLCSPVFLLPLWVLFSSLLCWLLWCWERLRAGGEGANRGWDGWMASPTQQTEVWKNSGKQWRIGKPNKLQSMGSPGVRHNLATKQQDANSWAPWSSCKCWPSSGLCHLILYLQHRLLTKASDLKSDSPLDNSSKITRLVLQTQHVRRRICPFPPIPALSCVFQMSGDGTSLGLSPGSLGSSLKTSSQPLLIPGITKSGHSDLADTSQTYSSLSHPTTPQSHCNSLSLVFLSLILFPPT